MAVEVLGLGDILMRLAAAGISGCLVGLNRNLHHQGAGLRTYGLVALSTAGLTIGILLAGGGAESLSRVVQGIMAGVGFLGGGVILTGGGAYLRKVADLAQRVFGLPCRIGLPVNVDGLGAVEQPAALSTAVGLVLYGKMTYEDRRLLSPFWNRVKGVFGR